MNAPFDRRRAQAGPSRRDVIVTATAAGGALLVGCSPTSLMALILGGYFTWMQQSDLQTQLMQRGEMIAEQLAPLVAPAMGRKDNELLERIETRARAQGLKTLFVLTTRTAHWFRERGFVPSSVDRLPSARASLYNYQRNSKIFEKAL